MFYDSFFSMMEKRAGFFDLPDDYPLDQINQYESLGNQWYDLEQQMQQLDPDRPKSNHLHRPGGLIGGLSGAALGGAAGLRYGGAIKGPLAGMAGLTLGALGVGVGSRIGQRYATAQHDKADPVRAKAYHSLMNRQIDLEKQIKPIENQLYAYDPNYVHDIQSDRRFLFEPKWKDYYK